MYKILFALIIFFSAMGYWAYNYQISIDIQAHGKAENIGKTKTIKI